MAKKNIKTGEFGKIFTQFKNQPRRAIKHLMKTKEGECISALYRSDIGYIDIVWGENNPKTNKGYGLKHIIEKHGEEIKRLGFSPEELIPIIIQYGKINIKKSDEKKIICESETFRFVIITKWNNEQKVFLLTAFDLVKKPKRT